MLLPLPEVDMDFGEMGRDCTGYLCTGHCGLTTVLVIVLYC